MSEATMTTTPETAPAAVKPMRTLLQDMPIHYPTFGPKVQYQPANALERRLLAMFRIWMSCPQERIPLIQLAQQMQAHEIRSYIHKPTSTSNTK